MQIMDYSNKLDAALVRGIATVVSDPIIAGLRLEKYYDMELRIIASKIGIRLGLEPTQAAAIFATIQAFEAEKNTGTISRLLSKDTRVKVSILTKVAASFSGEMQEIPPSVDDAFFTLWYEAGEN